MRQEKKKIFQKTPSKRASPTRTGYYAVSDHKVKQRKYSATPFGQNRISLGPKLAKKKRKT